MRVFCFGVHLAGGFVGEQHRGSDREGHRKPGACCFAPGKLRQPRLAPVREAHGVEEFIESTFIGQVREAHR